MSKIHVMALFLIAPFFPISAEGSQPAKPNTKDVAGLLQQLSSEDAKVQEAAALALKKIGTPALEELRKAANSKDSHISRRARMLERMLQPQTSQLWCTYTGPWDQRFSEVSYGVESVAFSPDSRHVASAGGFTGNVNLWDIATGTLVRHFETKNRWIQHLVFSHDGRYLAAIDLFDADDKDNGSAILVWETATAKLVHQFKGSFLEWSAAFTKDGKHLITAGKTVKWWDLGTDRETKTFHLKGFPRFWGLSSDGRYVMGNKENPRNFGAASLIDLTTGKEVVHFPFGLEGENTPESVAYSPDGKSLLFSGKLRLRDAESGKELIVFEGKRVANDVVISAEGRRALSAHGATYGNGGFEINIDCVVRLWDVKTGKEIERFSGHHNPVMTVAMSPDGRYAASGSSHGTLRVWKLPK